MKRINTGSAVNLQNVLSSAKRAIGFYPDEVALNTADRGVRKSIIVRSRDRIKRRRQRNRMFQFKPPALGNFLSTPPGLEQFVLATRSQPNLPGQSPCSSVCRVRPQHEATCPRSGKTAGSGGREFENRGRNCVPKGWWS